MTENPGCFWGLFEIDSRDSWALLSSILSHDKMKSVLFNMRKKKKKERKKKDRTRKKGQKMTY